MGINNAFCTLIMSNMKKKLKKDRIILPKLIVSLVLQVGPQAPKVVLTLVQGQVLTPAWRSTAVLSCIDLQGVGPGAWDQDCQNGESYK